MAETHDARPSRLRLRRSDPSGPGIHRIAHGSRGFSYRTEEGRPVDARAQERIRALVIPPAWTDVWISADERGHIQAVGTDQAGRRQYLYHEQWRRMRDETKYDRALELAAALAPARRAVSRDLGDDGFSHPRALAAAFRMVDRASVRIGGEEYRRLYGSRGITTLRCRDVVVNGAEVILGFPAKSGQYWESTVFDSLLARYLGAVIDLRGKATRLVSWRDSRWRSISGRELNDYIRDRTGIDATAKDFRTLRGTITAASSLARSARTSHDTDEAVRIALRAAADVLGNTPAIARDSYVDPRIIDRYRAGETMSLRGSPEAAILSLLS
ncbi:DNA topoisomerase IB [Humibacter soli]